MKDVRKDTQFYSGLLLGLLCLAACILSVRIGFGTLRDPGGGLLPFGTAALLGLLSLGLALKSLFNGSRGSEVSPEQKDSEPVNLRPVVSVMGSLVAYGLVFEIIGFTMSTLLWMAFLLRVVGRQRWRWTLLISILLTVISYFVFVVWLKSEFPTGFLGR
jgi:putative tricarboxylic transport membrane protein